MTKEIDVVEGDRIIAGFMNAVLKENPIFKNHSYFYTTPPTEDSCNWWDDYAMKYHSSWDWLMPAYKKFASLTGQPMPQFMIHVRNISAWIERVNIEEAFRCLSDAIQWYNKNN